MTLGYLDAALARGARLYATVDICDIGAREDGVTLHSARGPEIRARHVVMATGYEMMKGIPRKGNRIISSWSIATRPQPRAIWPTVAMIWADADHYPYIRTTTPGQVICGGEAREIHEVGKSVV